MKRKKTAISNNWLAIATIFSQHLMSSSLAINLIIHCLRTHYITSTVKTVSHSFVAFTSPFKPKVTSRKVSQSLVKTFTNKDVP